MKTFKISKLVCFVIGAVLLLVFKDFFVENLKWFIGGLMILYGALGFTEIALKKTGMFYKSESFLFNSLEIVIGATILIFIEEFPTVCIVWAAWSIFRESIEIKEIIDGELHPVLAVISAIESIVVIVFSVMLIDDPGHHHALIHTYLLCAELVLAGLIPIINETILKKRGKKRVDEAEADVTEAAASELLTTEKASEEAEPQEDKTAVTE